MRNFFDYYYFRFNKTVWLNKEFESTYINTFIGIAALLSFNILTVLFICKVPINAVGIFSIFVLITAFSYFYYINGRRWKEILDKYEKNDPYPVKGKILIFSYFAVSFIGLIAVAYMKRNGFI